MVLVSNTLQLVSCTEKTSIIVHLGKGKNFENKRLFCVSFADLYRDVVCNTL